MRINLLITGGLYNSQAGYRTLGSRLSTPLEDEFEPVTAWAEFAKQNSVPLVICISAGERRGVISDGQAIEFDKGVGNLHREFSVAGLGVLHEAMLQSDRMVSFK